MSILYLEGRQLLVMVCHVAQPCFYCSPGWTNQTLTFHIVTFVADTIGVIWDKRY